MLGQQITEDSFVLVPAQEELKSCRPVTIFQVLQLEGESSCLDKSLVLNGRCVGQITLIALVVSVDTSNEKPVYVLEDGTGKIRGESEFKTFNRQDLAAGATEEEVSRCNALEHTYVKVVGSPKKYSVNWPPRIMITSIERVNDFHEIMHHVLNVTHTTMIIGGQIQPCGSQESHSMPVAPATQSVRPQAPSATHATSISHPVALQYNPDKDDGTPVTPPDDPALLHSPDTSIGDTGFVTPPRLAQSPHTLLPSFFSPQRHQLYVDLKPLERHIMNYMHNRRNNHILTTELAQAIQVSYGCTKYEFYAAFEELLSEAHITSPLDDGYVIVTPRHPSEDLLSYDMDLSP